MEPAPFIRAAAGVYRTSLASLAILLCLSGLIALGNFGMGGAVLAGGLIAWVPHLLMTARVFGIGRRGVRPVSMGSLVGAEAVKLILTGVMFAAAFIWLDPQYAPQLFLGFGVTLVANLTGVALVMGKMDATITSKAK